VKSNEGAIIRTFSKGDHESRGIKLFFNAIFGIPNTAFHACITVALSISYVKRMIGLFIIRILYDIYKINQNKRGIPTFIDLRHAPSNGQIITSYPFSAPPDLS